MTCSACSQTVSLAAAPVDMLRHGPTSFTSTGSFESLHRWYVKNVSASGHTDVDGTTRMHYAWLRASATRVMVHLERRVARRRAQRVKCRAFAPPDS